MILWQRGLQCDEGYYELLLTVVAFFHCLLLLRSVFKELFLNCKGSGFFCEENALSLQIERLFYSKYPYKSRLELA